MKPYQIIILLLLVIVVIFAAVFWVPPVAEYGSLKEELRELQAQVERLEKEVQERDAKIERLRSGDRATIEEVARDKFNLAKPGEIIYQIPRQETTDSPGKP